MKKISLLLAFCVVAESALAGTLGTDYAVSLNNFYGYTDYKKPYNKQYKANNLNSSLDLYGKIFYDLNEDYTVSLVGDFIIDSAKEVENYNQGIWGEEIYASMDSPYGDFSIGQNYNVAYVFSVGAPNIGSYRVNNTDLVNFIANPNWYKKGHSVAYKTLNSTYINTDGNSLKASYITPEFGGLKFGATYVPETYSQSGLVAKKAAYKDKSAYIFGAYGEWDILGYELATSLGFADYNKNDEEYSAGISLYRKGWTLGASYRKTEVKKADYAINRENLFDAYREGSAYNIGISYEIGPITTGISYFESKSDEAKNEDKIISFSNSYEYNKYVTFSITLAHLKAKTETSAKGNEGIAGILGVELSL